MGVEHQRGNKERVRKICKVFDGEVGLGDHSLAEGRQVCLGGTASRMNLRGNGTVISNEPTKMLIEAGKMKKKASSVNTFNAGQNTSVLNSTFTNKVDHNSALTNFGIKDHTASHKNVSNTSWKGRNGGNKLSLRRNLEWGEHCKIVSKGSLGSMLRRAAGVVQT